MDALKYTKLRMDKLKMNNKYKRDNYESLSPEDPVDSGIYISKVFERFGIDINSLEVQLSIRWSDIIGSDLAKVISYEKIVNEVLFVVCKNSSYASFVKLNSKDIIKKVDSAFPELNVKKLVVKVSPYGNYGRS